MNERIDEFEIAILALEQRQGKKFTPKQIVIYWQIWISLQANQPSHANQPA